MQYLCTSMELLVTQCTLCMQSTSAQGPKRQHCVNVALSYLTERYERLAHACSGTAGR